MESYSIRNNSHQISLLSAYQKLDAVMATLVLARRCYFAYPPIMRISVAIAVIEKSVLIFKSLDENRSIMQIVTYPKEFLFGEDIQRTTFQINDALYWLMLVTLQDFNSTFYVRRIRQSD